jgi:uncharacterized membrane protein
MMKKMTVRTIAVTAVMAALVYAASWVRIVIPLSVGSTAIHLGNVVCLLSGLLMGPLQGGLAAGIGSCFFDLSNPLYVAYAPMTLVFKFCLGFVAGLVSHWKGRSGKQFSFNLLGGILGSVTYTALYLTQSFLINLWVKNLAAPLAALMTAQSAVASIINGALAVICAVPLAAGIRMALKKSNFHLNL